jgi:hypothetical protein
MQSGRHDSGMFHPKWYRDPGHWRPTARLMGFIWRINRDARIIPYDKKASKES